jgi:hypothetical protein
VGESLVDSCIGVLIRAPSATVGRLHFLIFEGGKEGNPRVTRS